MDKDRPKVSVRAKTRISKYAAGVDPKKGKPFEVSENTKDLSKDEFKKLIGRGKVNK